MLKLLDLHAWNCRLRKVSNMKEQYPNDIEGALDNIESQLGGGYLDLAEDWDKTEMNIVKEAIKLYKEKLNGET